MFTRTLAAMCVGLSLTALAPADDTPRKPPSYIRIEAAGILDVVNGARIELATKEGRLEIEFEPEMALEALEATYKLDGELVKVKGTLHFRALAGEKTRKLILRAASIERSE